MAKHSFVLKEPGSDSPTLIYFIVRHGKKRLKYSTGEKVLPNNWNQEKGEAKRGTKDASDINSQLPRYSEVFRKYQSFLDSENAEFDLEELRSRLDQRFKASQGDTSDGFIASIIHYIETCDKELETKKGYKTTLNKLIEYETQKKKKLTFKDITLEFYYDLIDFLNGQNLALNTTGGHIKNIKVFMDVTHDLGLHDNMAYRNKRFKVLEEESTHIYLTEEDIQKISEVDLSMSRKLRTTRDIFLIGCRTGLRFSDLKAITHEKIIRNDSFEYIKIKTQKTGEVVYIPLHPQAREIFERHEFQLPRVPSNQKFNYYIKEIGKLAGIETPSTTYRTEGGKKTERVRPKYELMTVHTARRTFATLAYKAGLPAHSIMKITGHRSERSFMKYIKLTNKEHAEILAQSSFFSPLRKVQ